ncbi:uncharacterized protein Dana_GF11839 [Drosophila ananassae]|uniref:Gustatory receptor n=1 Tax=Drosophila ananassae TaxID=7217 RepID=B3MFG5_DROAN|nr:putative gustatory receptor 59e [Drosophila ananassae]EDV36650.1 uncharacterized protein Dana_GF11839 [Drosophila ananassae]
MSTSNCLLTVSRFLGVAPLGRKGPIQWIHCLWCLSLLLYIWISSIYKCVTFKSEIPTIEKILYLMELPGNMAVNGFLVYYAVKNRPWCQETEFQIHRFVGGLDPNVVKLIYRRHCQSSHQLLCVVIAFHLLCAAVDIGSFNFDWCATAFSNSIYNLPALMISLGVLQYVQPVHILGLLLENLRQRLEELKLRQRPPISATKLDADYEAAFGILVNAGGCSGLLLEELRSMCNTIDQLHKKLMDKFGIFLLLNFANSLTSFCVELYLIFNFFETPLWEESLLLIYRLLWLFMHGVRIWLILSVNTWILEKKCHMFQLLNELEVCSSHLERIINRFLVQLQTSLSQPPVACGIVPLDTLEVGGFIGVLMAIVIFLIQIGLGNKSLMGVALNRSNWVYV